ncbi:MAG TPA: GAF domain-containing protein [Anaerolineaceae bacterium]|nr:GAF domain-containing protein [Longilinea sp.]HNZ00748.1 GAF domain-containing protein [Anaerolineaceae bacterium]HOD44139.1 GAF domain-containing protein [Anaerolineaceae bacterium]HOH19358.1 GAF domain-containing protein [Anaerolineaceae bacterium]HPA32799.1 GAF domain-containing protein [Anaerolineaceae bacterium]
MNLFRLISPKTTPAAVADKGELHVWRERLMQTFLLGASSLLMIGFLIIGIVSVMNRQWGLLLGITVILAVFLWITISRKLPFGLRAGFLVGALFLAGTIILLRNGLSGIAFAILLGFLLATTNLLGGKSGFQALGITAVATIFIAVLFLTGSRPIPESASPDTARLVGWLSSGIPFILMGAMVVTGSSILLKGMEDSIKSQQKLARDLDRERATLAARVEERTSELETALNRLQGAADISRSIVTVTEFNTLLQQVVDLILDRFRLYYVGIFMMDDANEYAVLQAGTGEAGQKMLAQNHRLLRGGSSMIGWAVARNEPRITQETMFEKIRFKNPLLPLTRSEMAIPISSRDVVFGAMTIQADEINAFSQEDISLLQSIADSLAIAIENAKLYEDNQNYLEEIRGLNRAYLEQAWSKTLEIHQDLSAEYEMELNLPGADIHNVEVPIILRDQVLGTIQLEFTGKQPDPDELQLVDSIAIQTALALDNARLLEETQNQALQEQKVNDISTSISRASTIDEILRIAALEIGNLPTIAEVSIHLVPPELTPSYADDPQDHHNGHH